MASKSTKTVTKQKKATPQDNREQVTASKGTIETALKKLIAKGKEQGFLTYDEINKTIPAQEFSSEQIEDAMATIADGLT